MMTWNDDRLTYEEAAEAEEEGAQEDDEGGGESVRQPPPHWAEHGVAEAVQHEDHSHLQGDMGMVKTGMRYR